MWCERLLDRPVTVTMGTVALCAAGLVAAAGLPVALTPSPDVPGLVVASTWESTSPEEVERAVTSVIEEAVQSVRGVRTVRSVSEVGSCTVEVTFETSTDMRFARLSVRERMAGLLSRLPQGATPPVVDLMLPSSVSSLQTFFIATVSGPWPDIVLRRQTMNLIVPALRSVKGVGRVDVLGGEGLRICVRGEPGRMNALGIQRGDIETCLQQYAMTYPSSAVKEETRRIVLRVATPRVTLDELADTPLGAQGKRPTVRLRDVTTLSLAPERVSSLLRINGEVSVTILIEREQQTNMLLLAAEVRSTLETLRERLPKAMVVRIESDQSRRLGAALSQLGQDMLASLVCIFLVLILFLGQLRAPALLLLSILLALAGTLLVFRVVGIGLHLFSLAGIVLAFGRLVDDAIVVLDAISRPRPVDRADIAGAVRGIALPVIVSSLATIAALAPLALLPQYLRAYFFEFGLAVAIALLMSLVASFTVIPVLAARRFDWIAVAPSTADATEAVERVYEKILRTVFRRRHLMPPLGLLLCVLCVYLFLPVTRKAEFWLEGEDTYLLVWAAFPQGVDISRCDSLAAAFEREVLPRPAGIDRVSARVLPGSVLVRVDFAEDARRSGLPEELKGRFARLATLFGGTHVSVNGFGQGFSTGWGASASIVVDVRGYHYPRVKELAGSIRHLLEQNPRMVFLTTSGSREQSGAASELVAKINSDALARAGVRPQDLLHAVRSWADEPPALCDILFDGESVPCVLTYAEAESRPFSSLLSMPVALGTALVTPGSLLTLHRESAPSTIIREEQHYVINLPFEFKGPPRAGDRYVDDALKSANLPPGYSAERSKALWRFGDEERGLLMHIIMLAVLAVLIVTASLYESLLRPMYIFLSLPFAATGLLLAFALTGTPFGRGGYAAAFLLVGIAIANAIVLVDRLSTVGGAGFSTPEELFSAARTRLRPVLMTSCATIGGMLPLLIRGEAAGVWYAIALGSIGGLLSSTVLTLVVLPVVYTWVTAHSGRT
jgi:HAE1 family hydrophobic/amphiphilic exporter-1